MALINSSPVLVGPQPTVQRDAITANFYYTFTSLLPGVYTVEATDACGKIRRATFTVTPSTAPTATTVASASCAGSPTGTLNITSTAATGLSGAGAPGTFQYALIAPSPIIRAFQNGSVFENLFPGTYTIAVKDACGNIGTATSVINTAAAPTFGTAFTTLSCPNGSTGSIEAQINAVGGGSPYTFELIAPSTVLRPIQASNLFTNLPPGSYTIRLTDVCGAQVTAVVTVSAATAPAFTTALTTSCTTPASGTITVTPGATSISPFTFELISPGAAIRPVQGSNVANTVNSIFTGLNQGTYTIRMTDGCNVPVTNTATIVAQTALTFPAGSVSIPSCAASSTGQITVATPANGLGAYRYELIAPSPVTAGPQYSKVFNNLPVGSYTIRITDSCGSQVTIGAPLAVATSTAPTLSVTNTASCATNTGTITCLSTTANQGGGIYQYALIAPSPVTRPNQTSPVFTGLPAGLYTVRITDQCSIIGTTTTTIAAAGAFTPTVGSSIVGCNGVGYFAEIIVTAPQNFTSGGPIPIGSGGGPYTFAVYDAANIILIAGPQASNIFPTITPLAGSPTHTIRVTDVCGNTSTATLAVNPPAALTNAAISATTASCAVSNTGVIKVTTVATGGLAPYTYTLIDAVSTAVVAGPQTATTFNSIAANATGYFVRVTDACGNITTTSTALLFPAAVVPTATTVTIASCVAPSTGRITVTPGTGTTLAGGTFNYSLYNAANTILVTGPQASPVFNNVAPASYTVRIIDRCGITGTVSATVASGVAAPTSSGVATGTCTSGNTGVITGSSTGGSLPITYTLVDQPSSTVLAGPQASNIFTGLTAGTYIVRVIDACGTITNSTNVVLSNLAALPTITTSTAVDCSGSAILGGFGSAGNGGPYTYALCTGAGCTIFGSFTTTSTFTVMSSGTYRIAVKDRCGNQTSSSDIVVTIPTKPVMTGIAKTNVCGTTTITPAFTGVPNTPYYSVDGANFSPALGSYAPGCHTIRVADFNAGTFGCASDVFQFSVFALPTLPVPALTDVNCSNGNVTMTVSGGNTGCSGSGATIGIKLTACTGCTVAADPIGTIKNAPSAIFSLIGATQASFVPVVSVSSTEICAGSNLNLDFIANYCSSPLPITIEYFQGNKSGNVHNLTWKINCDNSTQNIISLERSADNHNFIDIYSITTDAVRCQLPFDYIDSRPLNGINYYRLKIIDANGKVNYSIIIALLNKNSGFDILGILPNPVLNAGQATLNVVSAKRSKFQLVISDIAGKKLMTKTVELFGGSNQVQLSLGTLAAGSYMLTGYINDGTAKTIRFVKE